MALTGSCQQVVWQQATKDMASGCCVREYQQLSDSQERSSSGRSSDRFSCSRGKLNRIQIDSYWQLTSKPSMSEVEKAFLTKAIEFLSHPFGQKWSAGEKKKTSGRPENINDSTVAQPQTWASSLHYMGSRMFSNRVPLLKYLRTWAQYRFAT